VFLDRVVDAVLIFGFPIGVLVGYMWRDRISRARRARYLAERNRRHEMREAAAAYCGAPIDLEMTTAHIYAAHMTPA
jgi:hypothetical protein